MTGRYAVIPTYNRPRELGACIRSIDDQVDQVIVIDNGSSPMACPAILTDPHVLLYEPDRPPNLSALWNRGLDAAAKLAADAGHERWDVAVLNDDATVPPGWLDACATAMRAHGAAAACSDSFRILATPIVHREPAPVDLMLRLCGWAFVLAGETGLRADETLRWWYGDDDLDWRARQAGGVVVVPGYPTTNAHPNVQTTGPLLAQTARDRETFAAKWGRTPW